MSPRALAERARFMHRQRVARYHARLRERVMALFEPSCEECGSSERLEFAHVQPTKLKGRGRGTYHRLRDVERNHEAYRLLCRPCHVDLDYGGGDPWKPAQRELEEVPF